ncbi:MAG: lysophospholipid acyltransferase family protein [Dermatophilaceae bacterium]
MERVYAPVIGLFKTVFRAQGLKFTIVGEDHVPLQGGAVMAINHTSYFDFTYAGLGAQKSRRYVRFMAKQSIFQHRIAGPLMRGMKHIPVDRKNGAASYREALNALKSGEIVGVFPEATMSRSFELKEFKSGAARMARDAGVPILPTTLWGAHRVWTKDAPKHRGRSRIPIFIEIGEPIWVPRGSNVDEATAQVKAAMRTQLDRQQLAYPTLTGEDLRFLPARLGGRAPTPEEAHEFDLRDMSRTHDEFNS